MLKDCDKEGRNFFKFFYRERTINYIIIIIIKKLLNLTGQVIKLNRMEIIIERKSEIEWRASWSKFFHVRWIEVNRVSLTKVNRAVDYCG